MKEIELKVLEIDVKKIIKKLVSLGAKKILSKTFFVEKAFDLEDKRITKNNNLLRLRQEGKKTYLTYKYKENKGKIFRMADETEVEVSNFTDVEQILKLIGFNCYRVREKWRTTYEIDQVKVEVDQYPKIPIYLEFEGSIKGIKKVLRVLEIDIKIATPMTATQVIRHYGFDPNNLKFHH